MTTPFRLFAAASLLVAGACKQQQGSDLQSVVGLEAGLEAGIRDGTRSPTFIALADWFKTFRIENSTSSSKTAANGSVIAERDLRQRLKGDILEAMLRFIDQEEERLAAFEKALDRGDRDVLQRLLRLEVNDMFDIAEALLYKYGRRGYELESKNELALLLARRQGSSWIDLYAQKFLFDTFKNRKGMSAIARDLRAEGENYYKDLVNFYLGQDRASTAKLRQNVERNREAMRALRAGLTGGGFDLVGSGAPGAYGVDGQVGTFAQLLSMLGTAPDYGNSRPTSSGTVSDNPPATPPTTPPATPPVTPPASPSANPDERLTESTTGTAPSFPFEGKGVANASAGGQLGSGQLPQGGGNGGGGNGGGGNGGGGNGGGNGGDFPPGNLPPNGGEQPPGGGGGGYCAVQCQTGLVYVDCRMLGQFDPCGGFVQPQGEFVQDGGIFYPLQLTEMSAAPGDRLALSEPNAPAIPENRVDCKGLEKEPNAQALISCMRYSMTLNLATNRDWNGGTQAGSGTQPPATGNGALPGEDFSIPKKQHSDMQDQGQEGACTAFGLTHALVASVKVQSPAFEYDAWKLWGRYRNPTMPDAAQAAQRENFVSKDGQVEVKITGITPVRTIEEIKRVLVERNRALWVASGVNQSWHRAGGGGADLLQCGSDPGAGHAYSVVGYQDSPEYQGGGFVLIKNSWGPTWGAQGYARLPYACLVAGGSYPFEAHLLEYQCVRGC